MEEYLCGREEWKGEERGEKERKRKGRDAEEVPSFCSLTKCPKWCMGVARTATAPKNWELTPHYPSGWWEVEAKY